MTFKGYESPNLTIRAFVHDVGTSEGGPAFSMLRGFVEVLTTEPAGDKKVADSTIIYEVDFSLSADVSEETITEKIVSRVRDVYSLTGQAFHDSFVERDGSLTLEVLPGESDDQVTMIMIKDDTSIRIGLFQHEQASKE